MDPNNLAVAFSVWAAIVAMVGGALVFELSRIRNEMRDMSELLREHMLKTEARLTAVETHLMYRDGFRPSNNIMET